MTVSGGSAQGGIPSSDVQTGESAVAGHAVPARFDMILWLIAAVVLVGPIRVAGPSVGLDAGWATALSLGRRARMRYGRELNFTFGPWGFLDVPLAITRPEFVLGLIFSVASVVAVWLLIFRILRSTLPAQITFMATTLLTLVLSGVSSPSFLLTAVAGVACVRHLRELPTLRTVWCPFAVASLAALLVQIKFSEGVAVSVFALATGLASPRARFVRTTGSVLLWVVTSLVLWLMAGQSMSDIGPWLRASIDLVTGYTGAMSLGLFANPVSILWYGMALLLIVSVLVLGTRQRAGRSVVSHVGAVLVTAGALFFGFTQSFTRLDLEHSAALFVIAALLLCTVMQRGPGRRATALLIVLAALMAGPTFFARVRANPVDSWVSTWQILTSDTSRSALLDRARAEDQAAYGLPTLMVEATRGHGVSVDPWEVSMVWAYSMEWRPMPVFQSYAAYTTHLDQLNAEAAQHARADQMIIRSTAVSTKIRPTVIDDRNPMWESPRYTLAAICNYSFVTADKRWMLLRKSVNRCGDPSLAISTRRVSAGELVKVPSAGANQIVFASFVPANPSPLASLVALVFRDIEPLKASLDDKSYRLPEGLAAGPLLTVLPSTSGWPAEFRGATSGRFMSFSRPGEVVFRTMDLIR